MDVKDLRTEAAPGDRNNDGNTKYPQGGGALLCHRNKTYQDIGSNSLSKVDAATTRPCAVIGPDRVVPPPASTEAYLKKGPTEPWLGPDNTYRRPPEYPHKLLDFQHPTRNISPRQTFQENMQRIMVPPTYNSVKLKEDHSFHGDPNVTQMRNNKLNVPTDPNSKYCDVPYNVNPMLNEQKTVRNPDISVSNMNSVLMRSAPHGWPPTSANVRPSKPYPQDLCQYPEYPSCAGPRPMVVPRPHRTVHEEPGPVYPDPYYHDGNMRYKPYPSVKDRYPQARYEYIGNYPNPFHPPPPFPTHKYDLQKPVPPHPYPGYSQVPIKYLDSRIADPIMNGYQRSLNPQANYNNMTYHNQMIHPSYGPVPGNCLQTNKFYPYPPDASKSMPSSKIPYTDANGKIYSEYENSRLKNFPMSEFSYVNDITRTHHMKTTGLPPSYLPNIHGMHTHPYYRKEPMKGYEYNPHFRNIDPTLNINGNLVSRFATQFSPNSIAISPSDSSASNDTIQTQGTSHEDFGYVSQSSSTSVRSFDSSINRMPHEYRRYDHRYSPIVKPSSGSSKNEQSSNGSKDRKEIDVRQFLQMWNEGEEEGSDIAKEVIIKTVPNNINENANVINFETTSQEQLYVLGLVNVPTEELAKYEHIQKVSKLPENIKGYNNIELLHQFEEIIESTNLNNYTAKPPTSKDFHTPLKGTMPMHGISIPSRPLSPLDVEAKISQSVIHKDVGCNFEIKPCSPKMLNVEIAAPVQSVMNERIIEKVSNPLAVQSPTTHSSKDNRDDCNVIKCQDRITTHDNSKIPSCKMVNSQYSHNDTLDRTKTNYSIQDLESNSGVCLASLPRLDNDIELSFPEVNQQFINANKVESVITSTPMKDLPPLDLEQCDTVDRKSGTDVSNVASAHLSEKDFTKLSKYRKLKRKGLDTITSETSVQALRTDSVIIKNPENNQSLDKNPENNKSFENSLNKYSTIKTKSNETQEDPINLSVSTDIRQNSSVTPEANENKLTQCRQLDMAIDFSTNSNENKGINIFVPGSHPAKKEQTEHRETNLIFEDQKQLSEKLSSFDDDESIRSILEGENNTTKLFDDIELNKNRHFPNSKNLTNSKKKKKRRSFITKNKHNQISSEAFQQLIPQAVEGGQMQQLQLSGISTPDTEDSINVKMRELFGELSGADTEQSSNGPREGTDDNGLSTINDDDMLSTKMLALHEGVLKDQSEQQQNPRTHEKENQDEIAQNVCYAEKILSTPDSHDIHISSCPGIGIHNIAKKEYKKSIFDSDDESIKSPAQIVTEAKNTLNSPSCLVNAGNENDVITSNQNSITDSLHISKELLSPWIQKLIVHTEGLCASVPEHNLEINFKYHVSTPSYVERNCVNNTLTDNFYPTAIEEYETKPIELNSANEIGEVKVSPVENENTTQQNDCNIENQEIDYQTISIEDANPNCLDEVGTSVETLDDNSKNLNSASLKTSLSKDIEKKDSLKSVETPVLQEMETICKIKKCVLTSGDINTISPENCKTMITYDDLVISSPKSESYVDLIDSVESCKESSEDSEAHFIGSGTENLEDNSDTTNKIYSSNSKHYSNLNSNEKNVVSNVDDDNQTYSPSTQTTLNLNSKNIENYNSEDTINDERSEKLESPEKLIINPEPGLNKSSSDSCSTVTYCFSESGTEDFSSTENNNCLSENEPVQTKTEAFCEDSSVSEIILENETLVFIDTYDSQDSYRKKKDMAKDSVQLGAFDFENTVILDHESIKPKIIFSPHRNETSDPNVSLRNKIYNTPSEAIAKDDNNGDDSVRVINEIIQDSGIVDDDDNDSIFESIQTESLCQDIAVFERPCKARVENVTENSSYPQNYFTKKRRALKRSLSDTALDEIRGDEPENHSFIRPPKRKKNILNTERETRLFAENICEVIQNHRRNSISSMQNEENVSFCILIDNNCIITEECDESDKICFSEVPEDCIACVQEESLNEDRTGEIIQFQEEIDCCEYPTALDGNFEQEEKSTEPWLEDVAYVETVVSEDIAENIVISASTSPRNLESEDECGDDETETYVNEHTDKLKCIYGENMQSVDAHFVDTLYRTPQMDVDKTLNTRDAHFVDDFSERYDTESLEDILLGSTIREEAAKNSIGFECTSPMSISNPSTPENSPYRRENIELDSYSACDTESAPLRDSKNENFGSLFTDMYDDKHDAEILHSTPKLNTVTSCESSIDDVFSSKKSEENSKCAISSSPEVSSTTSEEKSTGIMLKITNYSGSMVSEVTDISPINSISCKYTEKKDYLSSNVKQYLNPNLSTRTLITKAAQKYIPPLKETIPDLKIKLPLPSHSLIKLKQMKTAKEIPKLNEDKTFAINTFRQESPKKPKPKFEDVLKSIDEIQYQKHKEKSKKIRKSIPKVVIKKNENGSHYASTSGKDTDNPDLTGRKWQPWVFLERNRFIDKMALKNKPTAIFNHRKNCYVLAEKFYKYKSVHSNKFVISQPKLEESSSGQLKYTIRLKHQY